MGKEIEKIALSKGHQISLKIDMDNASDLNESNLKQCDVAIEFTNPDAAVNNIYKCFEYNIPVVCGTTGWYEKLNDVKSKCGAGNNSFLYASNFSIGVNAMFHLNEKLAAMMNKLNQYEVDIMEVHHVHKKDAPSGTAITLANGIVKNVERKKQWKLLTDETHSENDLMIKAIRSDEVPGTHVVSYTSAEDQLQIRHEAFNRKGFAAGAVAAAEWLSNKKGFYEIKDMLADYWA